jgi:DNA-binding transcriptional ArsR family regulator
VRKEGILLNRDDSTSKRVSVSDDPSSFFPAATGLGVRILRLLARKPLYPTAIARELGVYHQTVYYHMRKLERAGLVKRTGKTVVRGGSADLYELAVDGFAVEFPVRSEPFSGTAAVTRSRRLGRFLGEFISSGSFDGWIVVGSPEPHGPNRTQGRDGHYAIQLGFALGQFVMLPRSFPVKLDVDLANEKLESSNLIVVGGPRTNIIAAKLNSHLPVRFAEESFWGAIVDEQGSKYLSEWEALLAKVRNPWNPAHHCIVAAGLSGAGTKASIIGLTNFADQVLKDYSGGDFAVVVRGSDLDGDGKVDSVEVLHTTAAR